MSEWSHRSIAFYGKGGVGKSTVVSALAFLYVRDGARTLQIGCDPKADSSLLHVPLSDLKPLDLATAISSKTSASEVIGQHIVTGRTGVDCLEAGGLVPGKGCGGLAISLLIKLLDHSTFISSYDVVIYDVLGDVVCGGFSVPMRSGKAREVYIVVSNDVSSLYAANNIAHAVVNNLTSGVRLAGLVVNRLRDDAAVTLAMISKFAERLSTRLVGVIPYDAIVTEAEARGGTAVEFFPESRVADAYRQLYVEMRHDHLRNFSPPTPMSKEELLAFLRSPF